MPNVSHSTTTRNSAFADDALAELSRLIGLTGGQSQLHYQDLLEGEALTHHLHLTKQPAAPHAVADGQIAVRNYFDPDNSRMLLVNPASWPVPLLEEVRVTWLMLSEGGGFNDGMLAIHVSGPDGLAITRGYMEGSKFHNGQIVGPLETAPLAHGLPRSNRRGCLSCPVSTPGPVTRQATLRGCSQGDG